MSLRHSICNTAHLCSPFTQRYLYHSIVLHPWTLFPRAGPHPFLVKTGGPLPLMQATNGDRGRDGQVSMCHLMPLGTRGHQDSRMGVNPKRKPSYVKLRTSGRRSRGFWGKVHQSTTRVSLVSLPRGKNVGLIATHVPLMQRVVLSSSAICHGQHLAALLTASVSRQAEGRCTISCGSPDFIPSPPNSFGKCEKLYKTPSPLGDLLQESKHLNLWLLLLLALRT